MAKKIGAIVSLSIIAVLIVVTIVMANVKVNFTINCATPNSISVQKSGNLAVGITDDEEKNKIVSLISDASNETALTALFNGELGKKATIKTEKKTLTSTSADYFIRYNYTVEQELKEGNNVVKDEDGNVCKYVALVFAIDLDAEGDTMVYVIPNEANPSTYSHYYSLDANFTELHNFLEESEF